MSDGRSLNRRADHQEPSALGRLHRALEPEKLDPLQQLAKGLPETLVPGIGSDTQLALQALGTEEGYSSRACLHSPTFPDYSGVEVEQPWRVGQADDNFPLHWNRVLIDLLIEAFALCNYVIGLIGSWGVPRLRLFEPELNAIK